jgi:hypothetical protein
MTDIWADTFRSIQTGFAAAGDPDAVTATYTPSSGPAKTGVRIMLDKDLLLQPGGFVSAVSAQGITIEAALDDLGKEPDRDETFTVGSIVYTVLSVQENDGHTVKVQVR